jgi:hypothetical protein
MKKIILISGLALLSCVFLNAMDTATNMAKSYLPGQQKQLDALKGFENYYKSTWFNKWVVGGSKRLRNAKAFLNYITILLDTVNQDYPTANIDSLPKTKDSDKQDVDLADQTKKTLKTWNLDLIQKTMPGGAKAWFISDAGAPSAEVASLNTQITSLTTQLNQAKADLAKKPVLPEAPKDIPTAVNQAVVAAKEVFKAIGTATTANPSQKTDLEKIITDINTALTTGK